MGQSRNSLYYKYMHIKKVKEFTKVGFKSTANLNYGVIWSRLEKKCDELDKLCYLHAIS